MEIRLSSGKTQCGGGVGVVVVDVGGSGGRYQFSARTILAFSTQQGEKWSGLNLWSVLKTKFKPQRVSHIYDHEKSELTTYLITSMFYRRLQIKFKKHEIQRRRCEHKFHLGKGSFL